MLTFAHIPRSVNYETSVSKEKEIEAIIRLDNTAAQRGWLFSRMRVMTASQRLDLKCDDCEMFRALIKFLRPYDIVQRRMLDTDLKYSV